MTFNAWTTLSKEIQEIEIYHGKHSQPDYKGFIIGEILSFHSAMGTLLEYQTNHTNNTNFNIVFQPTLRRILENYFIVKWIWDAPEKTEREKRYDRKVNDFKNNYYKLFENLTGFENNSAMNPQDQQRAINNKCQELQLPPIPTNGQTWGDLQASQDIASIAKSIQSDFQPWQEQNRKKYAELYKIYQIASLFSHGNISISITKKAFGTKNSKNWYLKYDKVAELIALSYICIYRNIKTGKPKSLYNSRNYLVDKFRFIHTP